MHTNIPGPEDPSSTRSSDEQNNKQLSWKAKVALVAGVGVPLGIATSANPAAAYGYGGYGDYGGYDAGTGGHDEAGLGGAVGSSGSSSDYGDSDYSGGLGGSNSDVGDGFGGLDAFGGAGATVSGSVGDAGPAGRTGGVGGVGASADDVPGYSVSSSGGYEEAGRGFGASDGASAATTAAETTGSQTATPPDHDAADRGQTRTDKTADTFASTADVAETDGFETETVRDLGGVQTITRDAEGRLARTTHVHTSGFDGTSTSRITTYDRDGNVATNRTATLDADENVVGFESFDYRAAIEESRNATPDDPTSEPGPDSADSDGSESEVVDDAPAVSVAVAETDGFETETVRDLGGVQTITRDAEGRLARTTHVHTSGFDGTSTSRITTYDRDGNVATNRTATLDADENVVGFESFDNRAAIEESRNATPDDATPDGPTSEPGSAEDADLPKPDGAFPSDGEAEQDAALDPPTPAAEDIAGYPVRQSAVVDPSLLAVAGDALMNAAGAVPSTVAEQFFTLPSHPELSKRVSTPPLSLGSFIRVASPVSVFSSVYFAQNSPETKIDQVSDDVRIVTGPQEMPGVQVLNENGDWQPVQGLQVTRHIDLATGHTTGFTANLDEFQARTGISDAELAELEVSEMQADPQGLPNSTANPNPPPAESSIWQGLESIKGTPQRTNGKIARSRETYSWDYEKNQIEVFNHLGRNLGAMDPVDGRIYETGKSNRKFNG